jgi:hypothetical protein
VAVLIRQITDDISDDRVYGEIHYRTDPAAGARLGNAVGRGVYRNNLRAVHDNDGDDDSTLHAMVVTGLNTQDLRNK